MSKRKKGDGEFVPLPTGNGTGGTKATRLKRDASQMNTPALNAAKKKRLSKAELAKEHGPEEAQRLIDERLAKANATKRKNALVTGMLSDMLIEIDIKTGKTRLEKWFTNLYEEATMHPSSRASAIIAEASGLSRPDFLERADKWYVQAQEKDRDFERWRLMKNLTPAQQQAWPVKNQHYMLNCAGRGWGKTMYSAALMVEYAYYRSRPVLYINKTFSNAMDQIWGDLGELLSSTMINPSKVDKSKGFMEFARNGLPSGSIKIGGLDNKPAADAYRGYEFALVVLDEAFYLKGDIKYFVEDVLEPRMGKFSEDRLIVASCSPPRAKRAYFEAMRVSWPIVTGNMRDNPHMQSSWELFEQKKALNTNTARREWLGIWEYDEDALIWHPCDWAEPKHVTGIVCGLDWGFDATNFVIVGFDRPSQTAWVLDEFKKSGMLVSEQVEIVKQKLSLARELAVRYGVKNRVSIQCDTNEKAVSQELFMVHRMPIETAFNKQNKRHSIRKMDDWFRTGKLFVPATGPCREECMEAVWKRDAETDAIIEEVDDDVFHPQIMDALRYAMDRAWFDMGV